MIFTWSELPLSRRYGYHLPARVRTIFRRKRRKYRSSTASLLAAAIFISLYLVLNLAKMHMLHFPNGWEWSTVEGPAETEANINFTLCAASYQPNCVIDGDTIHLHSVRVRIEDIDAPEIHDYKCPDELILAERATARLLQLLNAGSFEVVRIGSRDVDVYGRELRVLSRDGHSLGGILVSEGLARSWDGARHPWCV